MQYQHEAADLRQYKQEEAVQIVAEIERFISENEEKIEEQLSPRYDEKEARRHAKESGPLNADWQKWLTREQRGLVARKPGFSGMIGWYPTRRGYIYLRIFRRYEVGTYDPAKQQSLLRRIERML